ncbi:hypothetical protein QTP88_008860 [Uroleucon formosanum]
MRRPKTTVPVGVMTSSSSSVVCEPVKRICRTLGVRACVCVRAREIDNQMKLYRFRTTISDEIGLKSIGANIMTPPPRWTAGPENIEVRVNTLSKVYNYKITIREGCIPIIYSYNILMDATRLDLMQ